MRLTQGAEALRHTGLVHPRLHGRRGHFQPHYLSSILVASCDDLATSLSAQVSQLRLSSSQLQLTSTDHSLWSSWLHSLSSQLSLLSAWIRRFIPLASLPFQKSSTGRLLRPSIISATTPIPQTLPSMAYIHDTSISWSIFLNSSDQRRRFCSSCAGRIFL